MSNDNKDINAGKNALKNGVKKAANAYAGPIGGKAVDIASKTKLGKKILNNSGNKRKLGIVNSMNNNVTTEAEEDNNNENDTNVSSEPEILENTDNNSVEDNSTGDNPDESGKGDGKLFGKMSNRTKLIIAGVIASFAFFIIFIVIIFMPVCLILGICDVGGGTAYSGNSNLYQAKEDCSSGIMVDEQVYSLEDYVAGVVTAEADPNQNIEALKAQAIAARTYAIVRTNNCRNSISNSESDQVFNPDSSEDAKRAANDTKGLVLMYKNNLFLSEYDSFYKGGDYNCTSDGSKCSVTYKKLPDNEEHTVTITGSYIGLAAGGHGRGMSQVASYEMADNGSNYQDILKHFYSDGVSIVDLNKATPPGSGTYTSGLSADANGFMKRVNMPVEGNEHDNKYWFSNYNLSFATGNKGQCTWYAYGRANEILDNAGSDLEWTIAPNASEWLKSNPGFAYSTDYTKPKVGAIIVWDKHDVVGSNGRTNKYGHVGVVEAVNDDGTLDYSEGNINLVRSSSNPYGFRYYANVPYTTTGDHTVSKIFVNPDYPFAGYIYLIE